MKKKVLLTGHNGYIGSVMAPMLAQAGHEVIGVDTGIANVAEADVHR